MDRAGIYNATRHRCVHNLQRFKQNFLISKFIFKNFRYIFVITKTEK